MFCKVSMCGIITMEKAYVEKRYFKLSLEPKFTAELCVWFPRN